MRVVATILTYWPSRVQNIGASVSALMSGTRVPDDVIVLNNNPRNLFDVPGVKVVRSSYNSWTRGKYGAALMEAADYYLILDDDITVGRRTLEYLLKFASETSCVAGRGVILDEDGSYWHGLSVSPHEVESETVVDSIVGRLQFLSMESMLRMFALERETRLDDCKFLYEAEDILMGLANRSTILPMRGEECPVDLPENGESLCQSVVNYSEMRDEFTKKVLRALSTKNYSEIAEAPWRKRRGL